MKNLKIAMILVAAVAFFCSCGEKTVTVTMTEANETLTYDLSSAASLPISLSCNVTADAGIKTIELSKIIKNSADSVIKKTDYEIKDGDFEGKAEYPFPWADTLLKADLAAGYTVIYNVTAADKKDNQGSKEWTITITETTTPLPTAWNPTKVVLCSQNQLSQGITYEGVAAKVEDETIGVKCLGKNTSKDYNMYGTPTEGASWVFVENIEGLTTNEALVEAYNNGQKVNPGDRTMFPSTDNGKAYQEKFFISKNKNGEYVLVDYVLGSMNTGAQGNIMVFQYKKTETPAPAAK